MTSEKRVFSFMSEQEITLSSMNPSRILRHVIENVEDSKSYIYLVIGPIGMRTGKTWLFEGLTRYGYNAIELTEDLCEYVIYRDRKNHYYINPVKKVVIVVLNEIIDKEKENEHP